MVFLNVKLAQILSAGGQAASRDGVGSRVPRNCEPFSRRPRFSGPAHDLARSGLSGAGTCGNCGRTSGPRFATRCLEGSGCEKMCVAHGRAKKRRSGAAALHGSHLTQASGIWEQPRPSLKPMHEYRRLPVRRTDATENHVRTVMQYDLKESKANRDRRADWNAGHP